VILAGASISFFRSALYGIEEGAALDLLLNWSIVHQIASPVAFFGVPDLRAIFFVPLDMYWTGSLAAAKVYTMFTLFASCLLLYRWSEAIHGGESAMMATALLLISPIAFMQTDAIGGGVYLLLSFALTAWLDKSIHESYQLFPSWYFLLVLITGMAVSIHPMGLAIPVVLAWCWLRDTNQRKKNIRLLIGIVGVTVLMLLIRWGWYGMETAASNPLTVLTDVLLGSPLLHESGWAVGLIVADFLLLAIGFQLFKRCADPLSLLFIVASIIGIFQADHAWALIAWATTLYLGIPLFIQLNERFGWRGLVGQRGILLATIMVLATISMVNTKACGTVAKLHLKNSTDQLIAVLAQEAEDTQADFKAASQWPARTLLACRRDVLPLPPANDDFAMFRKHTSSLTHFMFNPQTPEMHALAKNAASLSDAYETIALQPGGVILKSKTQKN